MGSTEWGVFHGEHRVEWVAGGAQSGVCSQANDEREALVGDETKEEIVGWV